MLSRFVIAAPPPSFQGFFVVASKPQFHDTRDGVTAVQWSGHNASLTPACMQSVGCFCLHTHTHTHIHTHTPSPLTTGYRDYSDDRLNSGKVWHSLFPKRGRIRKMRVEEDETENSD